MRAVWSTAFGTAAATALLALLPWLAPPARAQTIELEAAPAQELDVRSETLDAIYGDDTTITAPCVKLNIQPTEKKP